MCADGIHDRAIQCDSTRRGSRTVAGTAQVFHMQRALRINARASCFPFNYARQGKARVSTRREPKIAHGSVQALAFSIVFSRLFQPLPPDGTLTATLHRPRLGAVFWCSRAVSLCAVKREAGSAAGHSCAPICAAPATVSEIRATL